MCICSSSKAVKAKFLPCGSGDRLTYGNHFLYNAAGMPVAKLSVNMQKTLVEWESRGYSIRSASVRFIVAWKPKDAPRDEAETAVLLADMILSL